MPDRPVPTLSPPLSDVYRTVRELCSADMRPACDLEVAGVAVESVTGRGVRNLLRRTRCALRHRRDANLAVGLAAVLPQTTEGVLDRSLVALLRRSVTHHREHCLAPGTSRTSALRRF